jgi:diketogulonate reductase-like aldo/keto reductase
MCPPFRSSPYILAEVFLQNELEVGQALRETSVPRDEIWLTSKVLCVPVTYDAYNDIFLTTALEHLSCARGYRTYS